MSANAPDVAGLFMLYWLRTACCESAAFVWHFSRRFVKEYDRSHIMLFHDELLKMLNLENVPISHKQQLMDQVGRDWGSMD